MKVESIYVDLPTLERAEKDFKRVLSTLQKELDQLDAGLRHHLSEWSGEAKNAYRTAHGRWRAAADEMAKNLAWLHGVIETAHRNYHSSRTTNLTMWRGHR